MIELKNYRIIDLSYELTPGERKIDGSYLHGEPLFGRSIEVQEFMAYGARMHFIQSQTHVGTHAEGTYKYSDTGADMATMPLESYLGEAVVCNFAAKKGGEAITSEDFQRAGVKTQDIVLAWSRRDTSGRLPYIAAEAMNWLIETRIKLLGIENIHFSPPGTPWGLEGGDAKLLLANIAVVDAIVGLHQITKPRVFFIALPVKLHRTTACWTRAIALEEV